MGLNKISEKEKRERRGKRGIESNDNDDVHDGDYYSKMISLVITILFKFSPFYNCNIKIHYKD